MSEITGIEKVLIANRGEIAVRIARTLDQLGITSSAIVHPEDMESPVVDRVDEICPISGETPVAAHLDIDQIVRVAHDVGADAIHPGYGFLSENADFAAAVEAAGIRFIGPTPEVIRLMGDKIESRRFVTERGFQLAPSASEDEDPGSFETRAEKIGYPILIKAAAGGGGKGMQIVSEPSDLANAIDRARQEALRYFANERVYAERYIDPARHVEVQILADAHGNCVHLGERDCSIQRRFQKLIEETPAPQLSPELRDRICDQAVDIARAAGYRSAGTVEFVLAPDDEFYFLEMNTRLQVEHPVTEMVTGIDLVEKQLRVAAGERLGFSQKDISFEGAAIECRVCAEVPEDDFRPAVGELLLVRPPAGRGVRFDAGIASGQVITPAFDPMLAKVIVHGADRNEAIERARQALSETIILGCETNTNYLERLLDHPEFRAGNVETAFIPSHGLSLSAGRLNDDDRFAALAAVALDNRDFVERVNSVGEPHASMGAWRN